MSGISLNSTSRLIGRSSELHVMAELTFLGIPCFTTEHPYTRADLIVETNGNTKTVQVKTMTWNEDKNYFYAQPEKRGKKPYDGSVDYFVFFCREENTYFVVPYDVATRVTDVTWTPEHKRKRSGGYPRKVDLDNYREDWEQLLPDEPDEYHKERLNEL